MDGMIRTGRFCEFVNNFVENVNKDKEEQMDWDFFLHKVFDMTFQEFKEKIENSKQNQSMSERTMETTIIHSQNILRNFNPEKEGGET